MNKRSLCRAWVFVIGCVCCVSVLLPSARTSADELDRFARDRFDRVDRYRVDGDRYRMDGDRYRVDGDRYRMDGDRYRMDGDRVGGDRYDCFNRFMLALDLDFASGAGVDWLERGFGATARFGRDIRREMVTIVPELTLGLHNFTVTGFAFESVSLFTGEIGTRVRFFRFVEPGFYAHLGIGRGLGDDIFVRTGVAFDIGATLDLSVISFSGFGFNIGFHVSWNHIFGGFRTGFSFVLSGAHIELVF
jgi:hypothetical protein